MGSSVKSREHFNLYYIFLEDKQNNPLSDEKAEEIKKKVFKRIAELNGDSDSS